MGGRLLLLMGSGIHEATLPRTEPTSSELRPLSRLLIVRVCCVPPSASKSVHGYTQAICAYHRIVDLTEIRIAAARWRPMFHHTFSYPPYILICMVDASESSDLGEVLHERLILVRSSHSVAGVLAKSMLLVLESRVASVGHRRPELLAVRGKF